MPLNRKGKKVMRSMKRSYGKRGEEVFYRSVNAGKISGVEKMKRRSTKAKKR